MSILPRELAHVSTIQPGDWTHVTGFRPVTAVKVFPRRHEVRIWWDGETAKTFPFETKDGSTRLRVVRAEHFNHQEN